MQWLRFPGGDIGPGHLQDESRDARQTHGDRVIADLMLVMGMAIDLPTPKDTRRPVGFWSQDRLDMLERTGPVDELEGEGEIAY
jgi:hypothetical protein